jgi:hypothetical protein
VSAISLLLAVGTSHPLNMRIGSFWDSIISLQGIALIGLAALTIYGIQKSTVRAVRIVLFIALTIIVIKFCLPILAANINPAKSAFRDLSGFDFTTTTFLAVVAGIFWWKVKGTPRFLSGLFLIILILATIGPIFHYVKDGISAFLANFGSFPDIGIWFNRFYQNIPTGRGGIGTIHPVALLIGIIIITAAFCALIKSGWLQFGAILVAIVSILWIFNPWIQHYLTPQQLAPSPRQQVTTLPQQQIPPRPIAPPSTQRRVTAQPPRVIVVTPTVPRRQTPLVQKFGNGPLSDGKQKWIEF